MASLSKKFSMWRQRDEEPQREKEKLGSRDSHESDDSGYYSKLSGLESQTIESSSIKPVSDHESPQNPPRTLRQKASSLFSELSTSVRSKAPLLHSISLSTDHCEHLLFQKPDPETPKAPRRRPSLISSVRSRRNPLSPLTSDLGNGIPKSPKLPVPTFDGKPPKLDVKIPSSSLNENSSRPATTALFRMMARTNLPPPLIESCTSPRIVPADQSLDKGVPSGLHAVLPNLEDPYVDKDGLDCSGDHFITSTLELAQSTEPKNRSLEDEKGCFVRAGTNAETTEPNSSSPTRLEYITSGYAETESMSPCPYCGRSGFGVSTSSVLKSPLSQPSTSQPPYLPHPTSLDDDLKDSLSTTSLTIGTKNLLPPHMDVIESMQNSPSQLLSTDTGEADAYSSDTSSELPSKRFRAAWDKRKAERHSRYLEAIDGAETDSDTSIHSSLKLRRLPTRIPIEQLRTWRYKAEAQTAVGPKSKVERKSILPFRTSKNAKDSTKPANTTAAESEVGYRDRRPFPMLEIGSGLVDPDATGVDVESPLAELTTMSRDRSPTNVAHSEQNSSLPLKHAEKSEKVVKTDGSSHESPIESNSPVAESPAYISPTAPNYTTMMMNLTFEDVLAFQAKNSAMNSSGSRSINSDVDSAPKQETFKDHCVSIAPEQKLYQRLPEVYNGMTPSSVLDPDTPDFAKFRVTPNKGPETESLRKDISDLDSPVSDSTDESCALTTHSPSCSLPIPFPSLHVRSEHAHADPEICHLLDSHDGTEIPLIGPNNSGIRRSSPDSLEYASEKEKVLVTQKTATATTTATEPYSCESTKCEIQPKLCAGEDVSIRQCVTSDHVENPPQSRPSVNVTAQETACLTASPLSLGSPLSPLSSEPPLSRHQSCKEKRGLRCDGSPCSRSGSAKSKERNLKSASQAKSEIRRFESREVKPTAYTGYELENELTHLFKQGSPTSTKSNSPIRSPRDRGKSAFHFEKEVPIISQAGAYDRPSRSPTPKRPTERMSNAETQNLLQKKLGNKDGEIEDSYIYDLKTEAPKISALVEGEASKVDKPRWRVPGSTISKAPSGNEQ
ncbi:hypothetical protein N7G274_000578 [Stereocaulon virgatum]|uniref:Uncharacterized protein n=1 Tax=Stereocaulon virgatum TaxID=373712 RepID=A0ABR4AV26_9LECA